MLRLPHALLLFLRTALAGPHPDCMPQSDTLTLWPAIKILAYRLLRLLNPFLPCDTSTSSTAVGMVKLAAVCGIGSALWLWGHRRKGAPLVSTPPSDPAVDASSDTDPGLIKKFSAVRSYTVPATGLTYPAIRTFYRAHAQEAKLPREPCPLPLLVFIHGLGGSIAQFNPVLLSLSNLASCLAIDLPGCGVSSFEPKSWNAYTTEALVHLLSIVIEEHRASDENQSVILVGHSMGCSLAALLASPTSPYAQSLSGYVGGLIAICPKADPPTPKEIKQLRKITSIPSTLFDILRKWDRRGGPNSKSVFRMAGPDAEQATKELQLRYNQQSRSAVWQRIAQGMCPDYSTRQPQGGLPNRKVWAGLDIPVFLIAGEADTVTPPSNIRRIVNFLGRDVSAIQPPSEKVSLPIAAAPFDPASVLQAPDLDGRKHQDSGIDANDLPRIESDAEKAGQIINSEDDSNLITAQDAFTDGSLALADAPLISDTSGPESTKPKPHPRRLVVKTLILPRPAAHALLFAPTSSRIISGLIGTFFSDHIDPRLSLGWQLNYLSTEGKWDVKNLEKWKAVQPVSDPIADTFRAMKTLREVDEVHTPRVLAKRWHGKLCAVIDISHDSPVYDPKGLEDGGIPYFKFPTVSKQPPQTDEVAIFIDLVDKIRAERRHKGLIGVHCHYGFNRTGFFLVSYLVERLDMRVEAAIDLFERARPPGIRHSHFIDQLHVRYATGLRRAPTL